MANSPADPLIEDTALVGGTPGAADGMIPSTPGIEVELKASAAREYIAGSRLQWYLNLAHALPQGIDDLAQLGDDVYDRMLLDAQVRSTVNVLKSAVLEDGLQLHPAVDDKGEDGYQQAVDLHQRVEEMLDDLTISLDDVLWDMLDAIAVGNRVAEQIFSLDTTHTGKSQYVLQTLAAKPRESTAFVVDAYNNVLGILGRIPGQPFMIQQGLLLADVKNTANLLPRSKFAVLTFRPKNGDPRGISLLRAAYDPWNQKVQLKAEFLKYLTQFATPSLAGFTPENAAPQPMVDPTGAQMFDAFNNPLYMTPEEYMLSALQSFANGTAAAFPGGARVQPIEMTGDGTPFLNAFDFLDRQITKAVLNQTLATEEGQHQSRAASGTHKDILDTSIRQMKRPVERLFRRDVFPVWLRLNGQENLLPLMPVATLGTTEQEDYASMWTGIAALQGSDYLHSSQYAELDRQVGLPERTPADATTMPAKEAVNVGEVSQTIQPVVGESAPAAVPALVAVPPA